MAKTRKQKQDILDSYVELLNNNDSVVFFHYDKLDVNTLVGLKKDLYAEGVFVKVVKNSLIKKSLEKFGLKINVLGQILSVIFHDNATSALKKTLSVIKTIKNANKNIVLDVSFGMYQGKYMTSEDVMLLSETPDKSTSISMILGILDQSIYGILNTLQNPVVSYMNIINAVYKN